MLGERMRFSIIAASVLVAGAAAASAGKCGDWSGNAITGHFMATAISENDSGASLLVTCDPDAGFQINFSLPEQIGIQPTLTAYVLADSKPPVGLPAEGSPDGFGAFQIHHAEGVERAILSARRVGIRFDTADGTRTYYFRFAKLSRGRAAILKSCPA